jgi:hypothetical protein
MAKSGVGRPLPPAFSMGFDGVGEPPQDTIDANQRPNDTRPTRAKIMKTFCPFRTPIAKFPATLSANVRMGLRVAGLARDKPEHTQGRAPTIVRPTGFS